MISIKHFSTFYIYAAGRIAMVFPAGGIRVFRERGVYILPILYQKKFLTLRIWSDVCVCTVSMWTIIQR